MRRRTLLGSAAAALLPIHSRGATRTSDDAIVIGQSAMLSSGNPFGAQVHAFNAGAQLVFERANRSGGVHGRPVRLVSLDDGLLPAKTLENCKALVEDSSVLALFGLAGSGNVTATESLLRQSGTPLVGALAVSDSVRLKTRDAAYYVRAGYGREVERIVQQLATLGLQRVGIAHVANPGGLEVKDVLVAQLARAALAPVAVASINLDSSNMSFAVDALSAAQPQAVILFLAGSMPARLIAGMNASSAFPSYYGLSVVPGEVTARELGGKLRSLVISQVVPYPWADANAAVTEFRKSAAGAGVPVNYSTWEGSVTAQVVVEAFKRAGKDPSRARVHAALKALKGSVGGMDLDFSADGHTGSRFVELIHLTGAGRFAR